METPVVMVPGYLQNGNYFIFRSNGEEIQIDSFNRFVSHQLTNIEMQFINDNYPFIDIEKFTIKKKIF